jgi:hypothetical protein
MTGKFNAELAEKIRAEKYREATERLTELEQERLNKIFATLGSVEKHASLSFTGEELTLGKVRSDVEAGDRNAMLELLAIAAGSLRWFDALPQQTREALADGLETMRGNLEEAKGFLPSEGRKRSKSAAHQHTTREFLTAFAVEWARWNDGLKLESSRSATGAKDKVAEESGLKYDLVHKRWNRHNKAAQESIEMLRQVLESVGASYPKMPRRRRRRP